jgi:membrane associated rhomboid family serine protease
MIPVNDTEPNRYTIFPFMTLTLIAVNISAFVAEPFLAGNDYWTFLMRYAITPSLISGAQGGGAFSSLTSLFLHSGVLHILGNMAALWVFGRRVEDACGSVRFLAFYLLAGSAANLLFVMVGPDSPIPSIGASGAVFGLMGAYLMLYPGSRIRTLVLPAFWVRLQAFWVVLYFVIFDILPAFLSFLGSQDSGVNYWAHLGGFFSSVLVFLFLKPEAFARYLSDVAV